MAILTSVQTPADAVNAALVRLGQTWRVGNLYDGSKQGKLALDIYGQTRDNLLVESDWDFAERNITLTLLKTAPANGYIPPTVWDPATNPPLPWFFEYAYPNDCLKVRSLKQALFAGPNFDPKPVLFDEANDNAYTPAQKVILANLPNAICVYTGRITDPTTFKPGFTEALISALARRLAPALADLNAERLEAQDEAASASAGMTERG